MDLDNVIEERHSCRRFKTKKVDWRDIMKAIDMARLAPSAGNIPTIKFMLVSDKGKIHELMEACQQDFVGTVNYVVVIVTDPAQCKRSYDERAEKYCPQQAGAAIENFLLKITDLGLSTCWIGAFVDEQVKRIFQLPEGVEVEGIFPIGYEMPRKGKQRPKPKLSECVFFDKWKNKYMSPLKRPEAL